jgi:ribulose 1,5-bisphosphate synthetase/thiazole synthase
MKTIVMTRRQLLRYVSTAGFGTVLGSRVVADEAVPGKKGEGTTLRSLLHPMAVEEREHYPATVAGGQVIQPARPLKVAHETDVLVVGGGPAGFAAAVAAARTGARTTLVERYGYLGGLWAGGMVLLVISTHATENEKRVQVVRGIADDLFQRLAKFDGAIVNYAPDKWNPTTDPEATKYMMDAMVTEAGVKMFFHSWVADVVMDGNAIRGVVFESKSGRQAILAKVVVDTTGDGDVFAAAGAGHEQWLHGIGLVHRIGNVDRVDMEELKENGVRSLGAVEPQPGVKWVNLQGPSTNGLDVNDLTRLEIEHRRKIWEHAQKLRKTSGGESLFLLQVAPQIGVRTTRLLAGVKKLTFEEFKEGTRFPDTIAVGGAQNAKHRGWPIPYGTLVPQKLDNLLTAGRSICVEEKVIEDMRLIGACLTTGHAAGAAAALAVRDRCRPRDVDVPKLQKLLASQGAYLG